MKKIDVIIYTILSLIALASRIPLIEKFQSHWDGPQYTIAVFRFSYEQFTPTPPGYPLFIAAGKFFYLFISDPHKAILFACVLGSVIGSLAFYFVGKNMYNRYVGIVATTIFLTASTFYYFSLTPYGFELLVGFEVLLAYLVHQIYIKKKQVGLLFGIVVGITLGIRPQEFLQIFPLILFGFYWLSNKEKLKALVVFLIITLAWLLPIIYPLGIVKFLVIWHEALVIALFNNSFLTHIELMTKGFLLSFGISSVFLLYYAWLYINKANIVSKNKKILIFYTIWLLPGFLYNLFIRTEHAGYQMSYLSGFILIISYAVWASTKKYKLLYVSTILVIALFNLYWFFYDRDPHFNKPYRPSSFHYSDIRKNDIRTGGKVTFVKNHFDPKNTLLLSTEAMWRPYEYYLKDFHLIALNALDNTEKPYIYGRYETQNWHMTHVISDKFVVSIPKNISTVVVMDDYTKLWIKNYPTKLYSTPGNSTLLSFHVSDNTKIVFSYHSIEIK